MFMLFVKHAPHLLQVSLAAAGMCMWVHAMDQYASIFEQVKPRMDTVKVWCGTCEALAHPFHNNLLDRLGTASE